MSRVVLRRKVGRSLTAVGESSRTRQGGLPYQYGGGSAGPEWTEGDLQERESEFLEELVMRTYKVDFIMSGAK